LEQAAPQSALARGTVIAKAYRVVRSVASGGMGAVYEVEQIATGARRALKVMHPELSAEEALRSRFVQEARVVAKIESDHVAQVVDAGVDEATRGLFIAMELLDGNTLSRELKERDPFTWQEADEIIRQLCHALGAAHAVGIVHRDLKPANVFLARSRTSGVPYVLKVLDFGIARVLAESREHATAVTLGTPAWMAPEQTMPEAPIGPAADVWSLGLIAFFILTGKQYWRSMNAESAGQQAVMREVVFEALVPASERARALDVPEGALPPGFDAWFARCVDRDPAKRFGDADRAQRAFTKLVSADRDVPDMTTPSAHFPPPARRSPSSDETAAEVPSARGESGVLATTSPVTRSPIPPPPPEASRHKHEEPPPRTSRSVLLPLAVAVLVAMAFVVWFRNRSSVSAERGAGTSSSGAAALAPARIVLRLHGSNTIGSELAPALADAFLKRRSGAPSTVRTMTASEEMIVVTPIDHGGDTIEVYAHGSATAFTDLAAGACDIGMASRRINADELGKLAKLGDMSSAASEHVIALDGIAVIVNPANDVTKLEREQIAKLFTGQWTQWSDVGSHGDAVTVYARDSKSGTYDTFKTMVLGTTPLAPSAHRYASSENLSNAVAADKNAIGFVGLPYVKSAKAIMIQDAGSLKHLPSPMTIATEEYPLTRRLYLYAPPSASDVAREFIDYALSDEGQEIVKRVGFGDLLPRCDAKAASCTACTAEYKKSVAGACRLSQNFRFDRGTSRLDTRALRDMQRIATLLSSGSEQGKSILLLGFADAQSTRQASVALSREHAQIVADQLRGRGLHVDTVKGFGADMPVADLSTEQGRERNERVEIWLR
jgi:phosphate transport system substrate-binding protein